VELVKDESFDIIHAHDWITYPAAIRLADVTGKPIIAHIHATEFDRSGQFVNPTVFEIERQGMLRASRVVAVSGRTREFVVERYGVPAERVEVVHNGIEIPAMPEMRQVDTVVERPTVLFLGRITMQKGPEYFIEAAKMVAAEVPNVRFVMAGSGDLLETIKARVHELGLDDNVEFPGFLRGAAVHQAYREAQVYVMPSVSEPFGLTALEAAGLGTPVVLSKSSGVAEVLNRGALKVDFWDTKLMARMIVALLKFPGLATALSKGGIEEVQKLTWDTAARMCLALYREHAPLSEEVRDVLLTEELASLQDEIEVLKALEDES
jgi:glycosyltransferase involved in cell wall biosynthesis